MATKWVWEQTVATIEHSLKMNSDLQFQNGSRVRSYLGKRARGQFLGESRTPNGESGNVVSRREERGENGRRC